MCRIQYFILSSNNGRGERLLYARPGHTGQLIESNKKTSTIYFSELFFFSFASHVDGNDIVWLLYDVYVSKTTMWSRYRGAMYSCIPPSLGGTATVFNIL